MNYSEIWLTFAPKEFSEITHFLEKIRKNNPNDLEVAMKSREKIMEIQGYILEHNFALLDFENFFNTEREKFFSENPILDKNNEEIIKIFFNEKFEELQKYLQKSQIIRIEKNLCDKILDILACKYKK